MNLDSQFSAWGLGVTLGEGLLMRATGLSIGSQGVGTNTALCVGYCGLVYVPVCRDFQWSACSFLFSP